MSAVMIFYQRLEISALINKAIYDGINPNFKIK